MLHMMKKTCTISSFSYLFSVMKSPSYMDSFGSSFLSNSNAFWKHEGLFELEPVGFLPFWPLWALNGGFHWIIYYNPRVSIINTEESIAIYLKFRCVCFFFFPCVYCFTFIYIDFHPFNIHLLNVMEYASVGFQWNCSLFISLNNLARSANLSPRYSPQLQDTLTLMNVSNDMVPAQTSEKLFCWFSCTVKTVIYSCPLFSTLHYFGGMI